MKQLIHAILLVSGTSIGAGLIALPMTATNFGIGWSLPLLIGMMWVAYRSSMMTVDLNLLHKQPASVVGLSRTYSGEKAFVVTLGSFYILSFSLLTVYFACAADTVSAFLGLSRKGMIFACGIGLFLLTGLKTRLFATLNSVFVGLLLAVIGTAIVNIGLLHDTVASESAFRTNELWSFLPILFTSFGVQNICPNVVVLLGNDRKKIRRAFFIGVLVPAVVYALWIACVLETAAGDAGFYQRLTEHRVSVGELICFLCETSGSSLSGTFFKILTLLAVITSAIGIALGLLQSLKERMPLKRARLAVCLVPIAINLTVPNVFLNVLSFGGAVATVFVFFIPYFLLKKQKQPLTVGEHLCFLFGVIVVLCELRQLF